MTCHICADPTCIEDHFPIRNTNMTLRDYFAAKAIAGLLLDDDGDFSDLDWLAKHAYKVADAMLKAREA